MVEDRLFREGNRVVLNDGLAASMKSYLRGSIFIEPKSGRPCDVKLDMGGHVLREPKQLKHEWEFDGVEAPPEMEASSEPPPVVEPVDGAALMSKRSHASQKADR